MEDTVTTNVIKRNGEEVHFDRAKIVKCDHESKRQCGAYSPDEPVPD